MWSSFGNTCRKRVIKTKGQSIIVLSMDGLCADNLASEGVIKSLVCATDKRIDTIDTLQHTTLFSIGVEQCKLISVAKEKYLGGYSIIFLEKDENCCLCADTRSDYGRAVIQPPTSNVIKGPREGFTENIKGNITLLQKRLKTEKFKMKYIKVGKYTNTDIAVCFIEGIAKESIVQKIVQQISDIDIDGIIDSSYVASFLDGGKSHFVKMAGTDEKPDIITAKLLEGRVAIIVDGSPIVLTVPYLFIEDLQSPEDYYISAKVATFLRYLRLLSAIVSIILPSLYVSLQLYNYQIIPVKFLITIFNATQAIPFEPLAEMLLVLTLFDILREANARMPSIAGLSLSIVGAIVLGDAAIKAGLLGAPAVVIAAISGIGLYTMPDNTLLFTLARLIITFIGGIMGLLGLMISTLIAISYLVNQEAYGTPLFAPFAPMIFKDKNDALTKKALYELKERPQAIPHKNDTRQGDDE